MLKIGKYIWKIFATILQRETIFADNKLPS